jgi:hypothetical protein
MTRAWHLAAMGRCCLIASALALSAQVLLLLLAGCTSNPIVPAGSDIQSFAAGLSGRTLTLNPGGTGFNKAESSDRERDYGYLGLKEELAPASAHCQTAGGALRLAEHKPVGPRSLPTLLRCDRNQQPLWYLALDYRQNLAPNRWILLSVVQARTFDEAQRVEEERRSAEERRVAQERNRKTFQEIDARAAREREARALAAAAFRASVKAGDRFRWLIQPPLGYAVGIVVRVEGDLVFVQFDNAVVGSSNTRYLKRGEIEPWDGVPPTTTFNIQ